MTTKLTVILILIFGLASKAKADTIDYWHIYYNNVKIREFNSYGKNEIVIKSDKIKNNDSLKVIYFRDTRCDNCQTMLTVDAQKDIQILKVMGTGISRPIIFSLKSLLLYKQQTGKSYFEVCYTDKENIFQALKPVIFSIRLE